MRDRVNTRKRRALAQAVEERPARVRAGRIGSNIAERKLDRLSDRRSDFTHLSHKV
jgi:hypothetical protein